MDNRPVGVFDSGIGGLTVVKELMRLLPLESIVYLGDTARVPYGNKSRETVKRFSVENAQFLMSHNVKLIVVACNTSSSTSLPVLRKIFRVPVLGVIAPGARKAVEATRNGKIGVIGTPTTVKTGSYEREIKRLSMCKKVYSKACPLFVPLVEEGWLNNDIALAVAEYYLSPLRKKGIDTLVLGCTHYPIMRGIIRRAIGGRTKIIDSASAVAEEVKGLLRGYGLERKRPGRPLYRFFATDAVEQFRVRGARFLGRKIEDVRKARYV